MIIKCKMCGGDLQPIEGAVTCECEFCGTTQTVPVVDNEKKATLFNRANRLRMASEFDKAAGIYETIVADFPEEAEAYWGLVLCRYGIEYVDDPATGKKVPTCHRSSFDSIMEDDDFEQVLENADSVARRVYREEAKAIEEIRKGIIAVSNNEDPYDIFICYKETAENGDRTLDSVLAQDIYDALTDKGYCVFFSRITLEDKLGVEYEPYIFAALNSAKIMLVFGTDYEYFNAVWVKNEWSRYLKLMAKDKSKHLIPCYKDIDAYDMPKEFAKLQAQDLGKVGAVQDLLRGIEKLLPLHKETVPETVVVQKAVVSSATVDSYMKRAELALEDGEWNNANAFCEQVLNRDPENVQAYLIKLLAEMKVTEVEQLGDVREFSHDNQTYKKLLRFADNKLKETLTQCLESVAVKQREADKKAYMSQFTIFDGILTGYQGTDTEVIIPSGVKHIGEKAFSDNARLRSVIVPNSVKSIGKEAFSMCRSLFQLTIGEGVTSIGERAFYFCPFTTVTIPGSVKEIGKEAFSMCENLASVTIEEGVTSIGEGAFRGAFSECGFSTVTIPGSVKEIGKEAFDFCIKLASVTIEDGVTSIGESAFSGCPELSTVTIPSSVKEIGKWAFFDCESLTSVTIGDGVTSIGESACRGCEKLAVGSVAWQWREKQEDEQVRAPRRQRGRCQHCGCEFKGFFTKKCVGCGKPKDY